LKLNEAISMISIFGSWNSLEYPQSLILVIKSWKIDLSSAILTKLFNR